jgi:hypothetical protein
MIDEREKNAGMTTLRIIWIAMLASLAAYLLAGLLAAPRIRATMGVGSLSLLRPALYAVGLLTLLAAGHVRRLIQGAAAEMPRYTSAVVASLAMCESVGIYGLILYLLGKSATDLFLLIGISAAAMVYYRPKEEDLSAY